MTKKKIDIPKGWKFTKLSNLGQFLKGKGIAKSEVIEDGIPCVRYGEIYTNHNDYIKAFTSFTTQESANQSTKLEYGDILFAGSGETLEDIGKSVAFVDEFEAYSGGDIIILRGHNQDPKFLGFLLNTDFVSRQTFQLGQGHSVVHIYSSGLKNVKIPLPPLPEQQKIATILSTWDKAIDKLTQLIAAKEQRKKGLMQQLLTGKKRFAGFKGDIKKRTIGKSINQITGFAFKSSEFNQDSQGIRLCRGVNISKGFLRFDQSNEMFWNGNMEEVSKYFLEENDIVISMDGSLVGRNYAQISNMDLPLLLVQRVAKIKSKSDLVQSYLFQCISSAEFTKHVDSVKTSSGIPHISSKDINSFKIHLPSIEEQQKIASILSAADKEIELLKNELESLQQQKKGLMQVLLTGGVRVKIN